MAATVNVTATLRYKGELASVSLKDYRYIDGILKIMYRIITKTMNSFQTSLSYTSRRLGDLGLQYFLKIIQPTIIHIAMSSLEEMIRQKNTAKVSYHMWGE